MSAEPAAARIREPQGERVHGAPTPAFAELRRQGLRQKTLIRIAVLPCQGKKNGITGRVPGKVVGGMLNELASWGRSGLRG